MFAPALSLQETVTLPSRPIGSPNGLCEISLIAWVVS
jgi:hypothetical protein